MKTIFCCFALVATLWLTGLSWAQETPARVINVTGEGKATSPPDMATINTGVVTQATEAAEALAANNKALEKIMDVLKEYDIASKDIQTSNFNISPEYEQPSRDQRTRQIIGYRVTNQVRVRVRNLPELGRVLDALVDAGSNQISGIAFGIDDPAGLLVQARNRAIADARSRAELYAHAAGVQVGKVISISEQSLQVPRPQFVGRAFAADSGGSVPVATGEQEVRANIVIVFQLRDAD